MAPKFPLHAISVEPGMTTALREAKNMWPFLVGFGTTFGLIFKMSLGITDEQIKKSKFTNPRGH